MTRDSFLRSSGRSKPACRALAFGAALGLVLAAASHGQRLPIRTYTEADGLRSSTVYALDQGPGGRMWFLTRAGAVIYDGLEWSAPPSEPIPPFEGYELLAVDGQDGAWVANRDATRSLLHLDRAGAVAERLPPAVLGDGRSHGTTRIAVLEGGDTPRLALGTSKDGLRIWDGRRWQSVSSADGRKEYPVYALAKDGARLFVGSDDGVAELREGRVARSWSQQLPAGARDVRALAWDVHAEGGALWLVGRDWVGRIEDGSFRLLAQGVAISWDPDQHLLSAAPDGRGGLYFGSQIDLLHLDGDTLAVEHFDRQNGLAADGATDLLLDRERNLWVSSPRGVSRIGSLRFAVYDASQGLLEDEVSAAIECSPGEIIFGHNGGISFFRDGRVVATRPLHRPGFQVDEFGRVMDLACDPAGNVWVAMAGFGLARIAPDRSVDWTAGGPLPENWVDVVSVDDRGRVTVGTEAGLARLERGRLVPLDAPGLPRVMSRKMVTGPAGDTYLATMGDGLFVQTGARWHQAVSQGSAAENDLFTVLPDRHGRVWVGSTAGLLVLDGEVLQHPEDPRVRITRPVYLLVEDPDGVLWIGTDFGVYRWDGSTLDHFTARDGLPGNEANRDAGLVDSLGNLWLGTDRGVNLVRDRSPRELRPPPQVDLLAIDLADRSVSPSAPLTLPYRDHRLSFRVRAVSFVDERQLEYRTRLRGHEAVWTVQQADGRLESRFSGLAPGTYRFLVQVRSRRSGWSPLVASAPVTIDRPFWLQYWFLGACALLLFAGSVSGHRWRIQRRYARELERQVAARTAELAASRSRIEAERERLARTLASVADGLVATDAEGRVLLWNRAAEEITGWHADQAIGRPLREVLPLRVEERSPGAQTGAEVLASFPVPGESAPVPAVFRMEDRSGRSCTLEVTGAPTGVGAEGRSAVVAFRDVTERRRLEAELIRAQKLESLGVLAGGIAHDFNNLLTVIMGYLSLVQASPELSEPSCDHLEQAGHALVQAQELSQRLLTFSGGGAPVTGSVSVAALLRESADFGSRGSVFRVTLDLSDDLWAAQADAGQLRQVFDHLLTNAQQAMPEGGTVLVEGENAELGQGQVAGLRAGRYVHLRVIDEGRGIPPEVLPRIFDPFFSTKDSGSGLGLTTVYSIVRQHGGAVTVESEPFRGTRFDLYLPASRPSLEVVAAPVRVDVDGAGRVLVMDDQASVRDVLGTMLRRLGYHVVVASNGDEAVAAFREAIGRSEPFDLVILDLTVPGGKGGKETLHELLSIDPAVRAVASSGYADDSVFLDGTVEGFVDTLPKPYGLADLADLLDRVLAPASTGGRWSAASRRD